VKPYLQMLAVSLLCAGTISAQGSASVQAGASAQTETAAQAGKSGVQTSSGAGASASTSANVGQNSATLENGTKIDAKLDSALDVKKNKVGDRVEARSTKDVRQGDKVVLKKGTMLVGHVSEVQARTKEQSQSHLGIVFDHAVMKDGQEVPFNASIQALAAAQSTTDAAVGSDDTFVPVGAVGGASGSARGGLLGGASPVGGAAGGTLNTATSATGRAGGTVDAVAHSTGSVGGLTSAGQLASNSNGVFGLQGLSLNSAASSATQGSLIVSPTQNVHLASGTQMLLNVVAQGR